MIINDTAFLCGYFSVSGIPAQDSGWAEITKTEEEDATLRNFYFPEFVNFFSGQVRHFERRIDADVTFLLRSGEEASFKVGRLSLWMMPASLAIFSIEVLLERMEVDVVTEVLGKLRNCSYYGDLTGNFMDVAIAPIQQMYNNLGGKKKNTDGSYSHLVENGNKFKLFQIGTSEQCPSGVEERNRLLYAAGTLSRYETSEPYSVDPQYYEQVLGNHRLGVFSSWTALALLDTVTFLGKDISDFQKGIWIKDYFEMIYIYELFRKCFLYQHNLLFRTGAKDTVILQRELKDFERMCSFTSVSYNFLPIEVDRCIASGLSVSTEEESLGKLVSEEVTARVERSTSKRDKFLLFLTCLASMSAVWDISCLFDEVINFEHTFSVPNWGYRFFSSLLLVVIAVFAWRMYRTKE